MALEPSPRRAHPNPANPFPTPAFSYVIRASERSNSDDTQARATCRFVLFKHVQKTGGRTLVAWLAQLPWVTYVPGSVAAALPRDSQVHPNSLRDFLQPYVRPTTQRNHTEASLQLRFTTGRCGVDHVRASSHGDDGCGPHGAHARDSAIFSRFDCASRCLECKSCRFASFSARSNDCSLYSFCDTRKLAHDPSYETVDVSNSPRMFPFGKTLSAGELFKYFFHRGEGWHTFTGILLQVLLSLSCSGSTTKPTSHRAHSSGRWRSVVKVSRILAAKSRACWIRYARRSTKSRGSTRGSTPGHQHISQR